jgi:large subunit ribosomal protein L25
MADIILNVQPRDRTGTGGARASRREGMVPGVIYGGDAAPQNVAVRMNEFRKALYTGKLVGHVVTVNADGKTEKAVAKVVQFHPVNDQPVHFDLYRVGAHQEIHISVPVHLVGQELSPGLKRGGAITYAFHEVELIAFADEVPESIEADISALDIGAQIHISAFKLPKGVRSASQDDIVVASITGTSAQAAADAAADEATSAEQAAASTATEG